MLTRILAWDYSGSTGGSTNYHEIGKTYVENFRESATEEGVSLRYLLWDDVCIEVEPKRLYKVINDLEGNNGTYPSTIIDWIQKNINFDETQIELWLVTDGEIDLHELKKCSMLNQSMTYALVKFIIINNGRIDMSVGASFISGTAVEIYTNAKKYKTINTAVPYDYNSVTIDNFEQQWPDLLDFIQAKFMGSDREALVESEKLGVMRKRLLNALARREAEEDSQKPVKPAKFSSKKKLELLRDLKESEFYRNLTNSNLNDARTQIDAKISSLVNYIHNQHKSFSFDGVKVEFKTNRMTTVDETEPEIDNLVDVDECKFYDAVTMEEELAQPILLLPITDLIAKYWIEGSYSKFRAIVDCPLFASIDSCVGHVYALETFRALRDHAENSGERRINPMTNEEVFGGLVFSSDADSWNDYVLAKTFFRGKKVCPDFSLWYYVIWKHCQNKKWIEDEVVFRLRDYAYRRLENSKVRLALSSLPLDPQERVAVPVACFYCTEGSSILFGENKTLFTHERLRMFSSVADNMLEILEHFGYEDVDAEFVRARAQVLSIVNQLKRIPQIFEKKYHLAKKIFKMTTDSRFLTYDIKSKDALKYFNLLEFSHREMIPFDFASKPVDLTDKVFTAYNYKNRQDVEHCPGTFRPYFVVLEENGKKVANYKKILKCVTQVTIDPNGTTRFSDNLKKLNQYRLVSCSKLYIDLTNKLNQFPTIDEFKDYVAKSLKMKGNRVFLFSPDVVERCEGTYATYDGFGVGVTEFLEKALATVAIEARVKVEGRLKEKDAIQFNLDARALLENC